MYSKMLRIDSKTGVVSTNNLHLFGNVLPKNFNIKVNARDDGGLMTIEPVGFSLNI